MLYLINSTLSIMKKLFYLLLLTPFIFLTSCSSGGESTSPLPSELIIGDWSLNELEVYQRVYNYLPNGNINTIDDTSYTLSYDEILQNNFFMTWTFQTDGTVIEQIYDGDDITSETDTWVISDDSKLVVTNGSYPIIITENSFTMSGVSSIEDNGDDTYLETNLDMTFVKITNPIQNNQPSTKKINNLNGGTFKILSIMNK